MANNKGKVKAKMFASMANRETLEKLEKAANIVLSAMRAGKKPKNLGPYLDGWFKTAAMHEFDPTQTPDNYGLEQILTLRATDEEANKVKSFYKRSVEAWFRYHAKHKTLREEILKNLLFVDENVQLVTEQTNTAQILSIKDSQAQFEFLKKIQRELGASFNAGSSRAVFEMPSKNTVMKAAISEKGLAQNKLEVEISKKHSLVVAQIINHAPDFRWIIAEKAIPLASKDEFQELVGLTPFTLSNAITRNQLRYVKQSLTKIGLALVTGLEQLLLEIDLYGPDLSKPNSWGLVNRNGKNTIVLIDYGLTYELVQRFYPNLV